MKTLLFTFLALFFIGCSSNHTQTPQTAVGSDTSKAGLPAASSDMAVPPPDTTPQGISKAKEKNDSSKDVPAKPVSVPLTVTVNQLGSPDAPVVVGVFTPKNKFLDVHDQYKEYRF